MSEGPKASYTKGWDILMEVSDRLREEEDSKGDLKNTGEARALNHMKGALEREIAKDATDFLKKHGFNGSGLKKAKRKR
jgi:hypothetical protein